MARYLSPKPLHNKGPSGRRKFRFCRRSVLARGAAIRADIKHDEEQQAAVKFAGECSGEANHVLRVSLFAQVLERQRELDLTEHFGIFYDEIVKVTGSVALLVQNRGVVVGTICRHLRRGGPVAAALLALLPPLALDLQVSSPTLWGNMPFS